MGRAANNAASLASLAGLAYLASRQNGQPSDDGGAPPAPAAPTGQVPMDNTDDGSNYGNEGRRPVAAPVAQAPRRRPAVAPSSPNYGNEGRRPVSAPAPAPAPYETPYDRMNRENREQGRDFDSMISRLTSRKEPLPTASDQAYKKGGKVKAKSKPVKMAKGGMAKSSASSRGDGIAVKGKTKGRFV